MADMFSKVIVNSIASYNFKHKHKSVNKNTLSVPYYVFNKGKLDFDWTGLYRPRLLLAFTRLSCKGKKKEEEKMFKKNVKGMQQNIKREFWLPQEKEKY